MVRTLGASFGGAVTASCGAARNLAIPQIWSPKFRLNLVEECPRRASELVRVKPNLVAGPEFQDLRLERLGSRRFCGQYLPVASELRSHFGAAAIEIDLGSG